MDNLFLGKINVMFITTEQDMIKVIPSGWNNLYHLLIEDKENMNCQYKLISAIEIKEKHGIDIGNYFKEK